MAAESAADWSCNLTANQTPVSMPSALIPIRQGRAMATIVAVAPVWSKKLRAIALRSARTKSGDMFITSRNWSAAGFSGAGTDFQPRRDSAYTSAAQQSDEVDRLNRG